MYIWAWIELERASYYLFNATSLNYVRHVRDLTFGFGKKKIYAGAHSAYTISSTYKTVLLVYHKHYSYFTPIIA